MAIEDWFEGNIGTGLAVGLGVAVLGPLLRPLVAGVVRPAAKMAIRGGIYAYDRGREAVAQMNESAHDMAAEARTDVAPDQTSPLARRSPKSHEPHPTTAG